MMAMNSSYRANGSLMICLLVLMAVLIPGCRTLTHDSDTDSPAADSAQDDTRIIPLQSTASSYESRSSKRDADGEKTYDKPYLVPMEMQTSDLGDDFEFPSRNLNARPINPPVAKYNLPMDMTKDVEDPEAMVEVKFNFDAENITNVVEMFAVTLDFQYFIDPAVSGSISMTIDTEMTRQEAWALLEHILWISGSYASRHHSFINILPFTKMPQERRLFAKHDPIPNVEVAMIRLYNTAASDIAGLLEPFKTVGATIRPIQYLNSLLIIEAPPNMPKLRELIDKLDTFGETDWPQISVPCYHVESSVLLDELRVILPTIGFPVTTSERGDGHSIKLVSLDRLQIIIAAAPTADVLEEIRRWVEILDREDTVESERIFFYDVKYNTADDLADHIGVFFNSSGTSTARRSRRNDSSDTPRPTTGNQNNRNQQQQQQRRQQNRSTSSGDVPATIFEVPVTTLADGNHNRLIIKTTPRAYAMIEALLQRLDSPPKQVLIQATIAEITLTDDTQFGFRYAAVREIGKKNFDFDLFPGGVTGSPLYSVQFGKDRDGDGELNNPGDMLSFIQAVAGESNTRVLNAPQIIAISDEEATINVGDSIPIASRAEVGDNIDSRNFTDIQYQDTGIILTVTPHITAKKLVTLDLRQEVSEAVESDSTIQTLTVSPTIQTRVIETSMIVENGTTLMMGGIIRSKITEVYRGLPIIKDIPYVGKLVSRSSENMDRTELLILITVNVIDLHTDIDRLIERYQKAVAAMEDEFGPGIIERGSVE